MIMLHELCLLRFEQTGYCVILELNIFVTSTMSLGVTQKTEKNIQKSTFKGHVEQGDTESLTNYLIITGHYILFMLEHLSTFNSD